MLLSIVSESVRFRGVLLKFISKRGGLGGVLLGVVPEVSRLMGGLFDTIQKVFGSLM